MNHFAAKFRCDSNAPSWLLLGGSLRFVDEERTVKDGTFPRNPCTVHLNKPCRQLSYFDELLSLCVQTPVIWLYLRAFSVSPTPSGQRLSTEEQINVCISADWLIALVLFCWADWWWARKLLNYGHSNELMAEKKIQPSCGSLTEFVGFMDEK